MKPSKPRPPRHRASIGPLLCGLLGACKPIEHEAVQQRRDRVLASELGRYFDHAFTEPPNLSEWAEGLPSDDEALVAQRWRDELGILGTPNHASGSLSGVALDAQGEPMVLPERPEVPLRYTCGVTLISPSLALTAAHCAADDMGPVTVQMYRPTRELANSVTRATIFTGSWPDFTHPVLGAEDGYLVDAHACEAVVRCDPRWGTTIDCPYGSDEQDVAVLRCNGAPGAKYGFLDLSREQPPPGTEVFMHWKHELYDASAIDPLELDTHYVQRGSIATNFHYQGAGRNQLLPLRSIPWASGEPRRMGSSGWTDMMGCHGTSGSGLLWNDKTGPRLWGIATMGSDDLSTLLCQDTDALLAAGEGPGSSFIGSDWFQPGVLVDHIAAARGQDCVEHNRSGVARVEDSPLDGAPVDVASWFSRLDCQPLAASRRAVGSPWPLEPESELGISLTSNEALDVSNFQLAAGSYRVGFHAVADAACTGDCIVADLTLGGEAIPLQLDGGARLASLAAPFNVGAAMEVPLSIANRGVAASFIAPTVIAEGRPNAFDTPFDRTEAVLFATWNDALVGPAPMRYTGDGYAGFSALLRGAERMVLGRQALPPARSWTVRVEASDHVGLSCGFVDAFNDVLVTVPCAKVLRLDARDTLKTPSGFFIEAADTVLAVEIEAVALASDAAPDADGDAVPDVLDDCPFVSNPTQDGCPLDAGSAGAGGSAHDPDAGSEPAQRDAGGGGTLGTGAGGAGGFDATSSMAGAESLRDAAVMTRGGSTPTGGVAGADNQPMPVATGTEPRPAPDAAGAAGEPAGPPATDAGIDPGVQQGDCGCRLTGKPQLTWLAIFPAMTLAIAVCRRRRGARS